MSDFAVIAFSKKQCLVYKTSLTQKKESHLLNAEKYLKKSYQTWAFCMNRKHTYIKVYTNIPIPYTNIHKPYTQYIPIYIAI